MLDTAKWHPASARLYAYWQSIAPNGRLPGRQHFDPVAIPELLPGIWLLDVQRMPFRLRYRLVGTRITEALGREVTGLWLDEAHPHVKDNPEFFERYREAVDTGSPTWRKGIPRLWSHKEYRSIENLLLPCAKDGSAVDLLIAFTVIYRIDGSVAY